MRNDRKFELSLGVLALSFTTLAISSNPYSFLMANVICLGLKVSSNYLRNYNYITKNTKDHLDYITGGIVHASSNYTFGANISKIFPQYDNLARGICIGFIPGIANSCTDYFANQINGEVTHQASISTAGMKMFAYIYFRFSSLNLVNYAFFGAFIGSLASTILTTILDEPLLTKEKLHEKLCKLEEDTLTKGMASIITRYIQPRISDHYLAYDLCATSLTRMFKVIYSYAKEFNLYEDRRPRQTKALIEAIRNRKTHLYIKANPYWRDI